MKALVLAAGVGSRLRPLTDSAPKAMVPISDGFPLLEHVLRRLKLQGVIDFVINLHHHPEAITSHFGNGARFGVHIQYSDETSGLLDTAGAIRKTAPLLSDDFLLVYADQLHFCDCAPLVELHRARKAVVTVTLKRSDLPQNGDLAEIAPDGRVARWHPRPHDIHEFGETLYLNTGLTVVSHRLAEEIPVDRPVSLDREVIPALVSGGQPVYGLPTGEEILDIGTPEKYAFARQWFADRLDSLPRTRKALFLDRDGVIIEALPRGRYLTRWDEARLCPGAGELIAGARRRGFLTLVVTNQPQIARGLLTEGQLRDIHQRMAESLPVPIDGIYYCPHRDEDGCDCRKPRPGMLARAAREWQIDPGVSWMIGDSYRDVDAGQAAGCRTVFVRSEFNSAELARCRPDVVLDGIERAAAFWEPGR